MTNTSRRYYEMELGAGLGPSPGFSEHFGYTEPLRRFIQREGFEPQANEIPNEMPSWMPGEDYYTDFKKGDPYVKVDQGFARLPGAGYAALHPELKDVNPEDYPDIHKMAILADVAPYSREYNTYRLKVGAAAKRNTELQIEYEKILDRVRQTRYFRLSPRSGAIQKHYRRRGIYLAISLYMNHLRSISRYPDSSFLPDLRRGLSGCL